MKSRGKKLSMFGHNRKSTGRTIISTERRVAANKARDTRVGRECKQNMCLWVVKEKKRKKQEEKN